MESTLILIQPDGVKRNLVGSIVKQFEQKGYKLQGIKMLNPTLDLLHRHYAHLSLASYYTDLLNYMQSGPVIAMTWIGMNTIEYGRHIMHELNTNGRNLVYASDNFETALQEIAMWFRDAQ